MVVKEICVVRYTVVIFGCNIPYVQGNFQLNFIWLWQDLIEQEQRVAGLRQEVDSKQIKLVVATNTLKEQASSRNAAEEALYGAKNKVALLETEVQLADKELEEVQHFHNEVCLYTFNYQVFEHPANIY